MDSPQNRRRSLYGLFLVAVVAAVLVHVVFLPRQYPGRFLQLLPVLLAGWASVAVACYALGRLFGGADDVPNMRAADTGVALFLVSVVVSGLLDTAGITVEMAPAVHLLPAVGVYLGLVLAGWGIGRRTDLINRLAAGD